MSILQLFGVLCYELNVMMLEEATTNNAIHQSIGVSVTLSLSLSSLSTINAHNGHNLLLMQQKIAMKQAIANSELHMAIFWFSKYLPRVSINKCLSAFF